MCTNTAETFRAKTVQKYANSVPALIDWLEKNIPEGLTVFSVSASHRRRLRTANGLERLIREAKHGTWVVSTFPNDVACLRQISAVLMEIHKKWQTDRIYLMRETSGPQSSW